MESLLNKGIPELKPVKKLPTSFHLILLESPCSLLVPPPGIIFPSSSLLGEILPFCKIHLKYRVSHEA